MRLKILIIWLEFRRNCFRATKSLMNKSLERKYDEKIYQSMKKYDIKVFELSIRLDKLKLEYSKILRGRL